MKRKLQMRPALFGAAVALLASFGVYAEDQGKRVDDSDVRVSDKLQANVEASQLDASNLPAACSPGGEATLPFRISVDGIPLEGGAPTSAVSSQRCMDRAAARADIQIRYDSQEQTPWLNVHATRVAVAKGQSVRFHSYSNYLHWIKRAEIRVFAGEKTVRQEPAAVLPVTVGSVVEWTLPADRAGDYRYLLRVYDKQGRFDETRPKELPLADSSAAEVPDDLLAGYGEDSRYLANIQVRGGAVTVNGNGVQPGQRVEVLGHPAPVDIKGSFAVRQILPAGPHTVRVAVHDQAGSVSEFSRNVSIANDDWFLIGLADLTIGENRSDSAAKLVTADESDFYDNKLYVDGRLAFYLKGKIKGEYLLTAAADTREQPLKDLFSNFDAKDPRYLLRRLDPDRYYPVYGDDSTAIEDAPTQGKFYVKVERGDSHVMWGNFHTTIHGSDLVQYNRGLYGGRVKLVSEESTPDGDRRGMLEAFGADPGTLPGRDEFRGTGGSLYYLRRQDVSQGSERVWIEVRDKDTGLVLENQYLAPEQDYEVNYLQGRVILLSPLASTADDSLLVSSGSLSGHPQFLVVSYEYTPGVSEADDMVFGGRAEYWATDEVRVGVTGYSQDATGMSQEITGADLLLRHTPVTYLKLEVAHSDGSGSGNTSSIDGGFNFNSVTSPGDDADAYRVEAAVDFSDLGGSAKGRAKLYWQDRQAGFSSPGLITGADAAEQAGIAVEWNASEETTVAVKADRSDQLTREYRGGEVDVKSRVADHWTLGLGVRSDSVELGTATASETLNEEGDRTDVALRAEYDSDPAGDGDWGLYGYTQGTVHRSGDRDRNNRVGVGGDIRINERLTLQGELSGGNGGLGALLGSDYQLDDNSNLYLNYQLTTDRTDTGYRGRQGILTTGARVRFDDHYSVFGEERLQHGDGPSGLVHAFGLDVTPDERWTYGVSFEAGDLSDPLAGDLERWAVGLSLGYRKEETRYAANLEYRDDEGSSGDRHTWLMRNNLNYGLDPDWRFIGKLNFSFSNGSGGDFYDGDYVEAVTGFAYRPIANDRLNALVKYTFLYDLPPSEQLTGSDVLADYAQRSHVFAVDLTYDLEPWVSVGGKYAIRHGELRYSRDEGPWEDSRAQLGVVRADFHWVKEWDILVEGRVLDVAAAEDRRSGALLAVYRHFGDHVKAGVGYNFTDFSDDLTDLSYDSRGWFINVVGKY
jgi:hypothetical protein